MRKLVVLMLLLFCANFTNASNKEIVVDEFYSEINIGKYLEYYIPDKPTTVEEILKINDFRAVPDSLPNLGMVNNGVWVKFKVSNQSGRSRLLLKVANPLISDMYLYSADDKGKYTVVERAGERFKIANPDFQHIPNPVFDLRLESDIPKTFYLFIHSEEQLILPIYITSPRLLYERLAIENVIMGVFIGIMSIMILYNFFLYISIKSRTYLYYVLYVTFLMFTQVGIEGYTSLYLWPNSEFLKLNATYIFGSLAGIMALVFASEFLRVKYVLPKAKYLIWGLSGLFIIAILMAFVNKRELGFLIMQSTTGISAVFVLLLSIVAYNKKSPMALSYMIAWSTFLICCIIFLLKDINVLPYNTFTRYIVKIGACIEVALLSFSLAARINVLKRQRDRSRQMALEIAQKNEEIIIRQNQELESKVEERTVALQHKNEKLREAYYDLQKTQAKLIASEKMASLGQLIAGIAHEINNPINFVASNIKPLHRDVLTVQSYINDVEVLVQHSDAEKVNQQIQRLRNDYEIDEIIEEVEDLMQGIKEGSERTTEIVKGLLSFSREDEDKSRLASVASLIDSTLLLIKSNTSKIKIEKDYNSSVDIECYPSKLSQVFLNILTNGIQALNTKFGDDLSTAFIKISIYQEESKYLNIDIQDNATGIPEDLIQKVFDPFFTTKDVGEGTGLGLYIVFNIIKNHQGDIVVQSIAGEGTTFKIKLPVRFEDSNL